MRFAGRFALVTTLGLVGLPVYAQAPLTFTGGSGTPITVTLTAPVTYTVTAPGPFTTLIFVFKDTGNPFANVFPAITGTLAVSVNGGAPQLITGINSGSNFNEVLPTDTYAYTFSSSASNGDTVTLLPGSVQTVNPRAAPAPSNGKYVTFLSNDIGGRISTFGVSNVAAPEPGTLALLLVGGAFVARRRKRSN